MWTDLCSLIAEAVAERAMCPTGKTSREQKETTHTENNDHWFYFTILLPVFSHCSSLTFKGFSVSNSQMKKFDFLSFIYWLRLQDTFQGLACSSQWSFSGSPEDTSFPVLNPLTRESKGVMKSSTEPSTKCKMTYDYRCLCIKGDLRFI